METRTLPTSVSWYAVYTHPKQEDRANSNLIAHGIETFTPKLKEPRYSGFKTKTIGVIHHLFPRYIFARFHIDNIHKIRYTRGIHSVVSFDNKPLAIDDVVIDVIRSNLGKDGFVTIGSELVPGEKVVVTDGPLRNLTGVFEREMKGTDRVMVLLDTLTYQARFIINRKLVKKSESEKRPGLRPLVILGFSFLAEIFIQLEAFVPSLMAPLAH